MPQNQKRRQRALTQKAAKRRHKAKVFRRFRPSTMRTVLREAAGWPLLECLITRDWADEDKLVQILVARRGPPGDVAAALFLVDLACLGVKDALVTMLSATDYEYGLRGRLVGPEPLESADLNLAARIIREGIAYARRLGFSPHRDYHDAAVLLGDADADACDIPIPLGKDGKPFYVSGPRDDAHKIVTQLARAVGPGNFDYLVVLDAPPDFFDEA